MGLPKVTKQGGDLCSSVTGPASIQEGLVKPQLGGELGGGQAWAGVGTEQY